MVEDMSDKELGVIYEFDSFFANEDDPESGFSDTGMYEVDICEKHYLPLKEFNFDTEECMGCEPPTGNDLDGEGNPWPLDSADTGALQPECGVHGCNYTPAYIRIAIPRDKVDRFVFIGDITNE